MYRKWSKSEITSKNTWTLKLINHYGFICSCDRRLHSTGDGKDECCSIKRGACWCTSGAKIG